MTRNLIVMAGGGTGGHLFPGIAVARALAQVADPAPDVTFLTTSRALDAELLGRTPFTQIPQTVRPFSTRPWDWPGFWLAWRRSVRAAITYLRRNEPHAVLGLGGYAAGPPIVAARALGMRTAILNPDAVPGRANRYLARRADLIAVQWEASLAHFGSQAATGTARALGCPIRAEFGAADGTAGRRHFGLAPDRPLLLATGASQGARTVNEAVVNIWPAFAAAHREWQLLHLTGAVDEKNVRKAYEAAGVEATVQAFTHEMPLALAAADAVVSRAGASTLAEITALRKPSILLPYPYHRDRHQHANAQVLVNAGAAILIEDTKDVAQNGPALRAALERIADHATRNQMATAAGALSRPNAAREVAQWLSA
ncbi:MAG: UDP-N-acetylglucosamine--N-acetylmuramyl-(pentapeptide) pyrophosphoryl-undecaprenol N-acetylglucosamine transferase [Phycisphaerae bacterium]